MLTRVATIVLVFGLTFAERAEAQIPKPTSEQKTSVATPQDPQDPLGRDTPQSAVMTFLKAIQKENYERAAEYLDSRIKLPERQELARQLGVILDRKLSVRLSALSDKPDGNPDDGLRPNRDLLGIIPSDLGNVDVLLDRVQRGKDRPIWLFSSESLQEVPRLYGELEETWFERYVPEQLRTRRLFFIPLYQWIEALLGLPLILGLASILTRILTAFLRPLLRRLTHEPDDRRLASITWPLRLEVLALLIYWTSRYAGSLLVRRFWGFVAVTLGVVAVTWLLMRLGDVITELLSRRLLRVNRSVDVMLLRLINRLGKAALATLCALLLLRLSGFDLTAVLTGLGLGGVAIAFAAQKTIENLFGGIMVISDKPIQVGDFCRAGEFQGVVEDIGLRSTRLRTLERTIVSIPNGQLATMSLENFTQRDRIRFRHLIGLRYETAADQLRYVLAEIRRLLYEHSKVDSTDARVRFVGFGSSSLDLEVLAYVLATDYPVFLGIQEDLLLRIMDIIEASGTSVAFPSQTTYVVGDSGLNPVRSREAIEKVQHWREHSDLPFPDLPVERIAELDGTIEYPPAGSAVKSKNANAGTTEQP
ncbi:MAG TPA: mechanosensitive ion channel family protein [Terriglobia bacterium]|nr:mechanosensitive ion channel family protein [Terriglobia bacterium]